MGLAWALLTSAPLAQADLGHLPPLTQEKPGPADCSAQEKGNGLRGSRAGSSAEFAAVASFTGSYSCSAAA